ncbi:MAG: NAD+ synthetase [Alphaproteobacteria bacterium]|nr:NAD+ synthetase [Alphaproteobacteria bacterium]
MTPLPNLKIGIAQIAPEAMNMMANIKKHEEYIKQAAQQGVELLVFPELSLTGYEFDENFPDLAISQNDEILKHLASVEPNMRIVVGFIEESVSSLFHNAAAKLYNGNVDFVHRKINLPTYGDLNEDKWFSEGRSIESFIVDHWRAGILICADLWNPALVHLVALHGAKILIAPINSADASVKFDNQSNWARTMSFYSFIYGMPSIMANRVGTESGKRFWGRSCIYDAHGNLIIEAQKYEEDLIVGEIEWNTVKRVRFDLPTLRDANFSLVLREMKRLDNLLT